MNRNETIGRCELCGLIDHHLIKGECPACRHSDRAATVRSFACCSARINGRTKATRPLNATVLIETDSAANQIIRLRPVGKVNAEGREGALGQEVGHA